MPTTISGTDGLSTTGGVGFNAGFGSAGAAYGCRAWVNFNGTGTVAIRASGNVTSITDNGVGDYTVNFTNAMPDVNYSWVVSTGYGTTSASDGLTACLYGAFATYQLASSVRMLVTDPSSATAFDAVYIGVAIFR